MSHRKFEAPRHGSLGFLPRKRSKKIRGQIRAFPADDQTKPCHLTAFMGFKAGMTLVVRELDKLGSKMHKKEVLEAVTIIETPPLIVIGVVGYIETPRGLRQYGTVWAQHIGDGAKRRMTSNWSKNKVHSFKHHVNRYANDQGYFFKKIDRLTRYSAVIRVIAHTQMDKVKLVCKKAYICEIQVNGGTIQQKVSFARKLFEKAVPVAGVFEENEMIDIVGVTKGHGFNGVVQRWGVKKLPRKTHKGLRKVACIGAWHPSRVSWTVPRAGQMGYHHRTMINNKIYRIGKGSRGEGGKITHTNAMTEFDLTEKSITPIGGFVRYGTVNEDFVMVRGSIIGPKKRIVTLRKSIHPVASRSALEKISLKFIDTASKFGAGRYQTSDEKAKFLGPMKPRPGPPASVIAARKAAGKK